MAVTWKINGTPVETLGVEKVALELVNQQPDKLSFVRRESEFDTNAEYTSAPEVEIAGGGGTGAAAHATVTDGVISSLVLDDGGDGYTAPPNVVFTGGGSFGAAAIAELTPTEVASGALVNSGTGYSTAPTVNVTGGGGSGAAFTAVLATRAVASLALLSGGSGYTSTPSVSITGGGGTGATATATLSAGSVVSITITNGGSGYTSAPTISFTGGGGSGAAAVANLTATSIASAALTSAGGGYVTAPTVTVSGGGGTGATVTAALAATTLQAIEVTSGGSGYTTAPSVSITGGGGTGATAVANLAAGSVVSITLTNGGTGYAGALFVSITGGGGSGATATATLTATGVAQVYPPTTFNSGWSTTPTVSFSGGGGGSGAAATATVDGIVTSLSLTNFGSGYTSRPTVSFTGGGGSGAEAWCEINTAGKVSKIVLLRRGTGYTSAPTVVFSGGGGSGAAATANQASAIVDVTVTNPGSGYISEPSVTFTAPGKSAAGSSSLVRTSVASVAVGSGGSGYTSAPSVSITNSVVVTALVYGKFSAGVLTDVTLCDISSSGVPFRLGGSNYTAAPAITVSASVGSGATATASLTGDAISSITVTNGGSGYTQPESGTFVTVAAPTQGTGAAATANRSVAVTSITITNGGSGYTSTPSVSFTGGGGTGAAATASLTPTSLASLTVTNGGTGYTSAASLSIPAGTAPGGTAATGETTLTGTTIASATVTAGGDNYTTSPTVGFTGGGGTGATATATVSRTVASLTLTAPGSGYTSTPSLSITGGGGTGATGSVTLATAGVASLTLEDAGSGYTSRPTLTIVGGGGSGATASAVLVGTSVGALILQSNGGVLPFDAAIVLTREESGIEETWFQGVIRETPRTRGSRENSIGYVACGPWQWLERIPYLQTFQQAVDPSSPTSELTGYQRGRVVIAQDDNGLKISLGAFLETVIDYALTAKPGVMQRGSFDALNVTIPWDEVVDLSCAEVISRALSVLPDTVCSWNYNVSPPLLSIERRAELPSISLAVQPNGAADSPSYAPAESLDLRERNDLRKAGVYLLYLATNRSNGAAWETATPDVYPPGTVANDPNTLFRTIQLAGSMAQSTELSQKVDVDPLPSALDYDSTTFLASGDQFNALRAWWFNHAPELQSSFVTIKGFVKCSRAGTNVATLTNELVAGAITDWMEDNQNIAQEQQVVTAFISYEETLPTDATKKARHLKKFVAPITATNAQTRTYRFTAEAAYTPPEEVPAGLAQAIYDAISTPQYDGSVLLLEKEATRRQLVGCVLNLTQTLADWSTMNALVQRAKIDIDKGSTSIVVGPPRQVSPDTLAELYRANRNRQPVTSYLVRTTGVTGTQGGTQGLGRHHRNGARASGIAQAPGRYTAALSVAGAVPTNTEISTAIASAYTGDAIPTEGDTISLTVSGTVKFQAIVTLTAIAVEGWRRVSWTWSSVTFYAWVQQIGIY